MQSKRERARAHLCECLGVRHVLFDARILPEIRLDEPLRAIPPAHQIKTLLFHCHTISASTAYALRTVCLGTDGDPRGLGVSYERGTPVDASFLFPVLAALTSCFLLDDIYTSCNHSIWDPDHSLLIRTVSRATFSQFGYSHQFASGRLRW